MFWNSLTLVGLFCFLLWWAGVIKERLRVRTAGIDWSKATLSSAPLRLGGSVSSPRRGASQKQFTSRPTKMGRWNDPR